MIRWALSSALLLAFCACSDKKAPETPAPPAPQPAAQASEKTPPPEKAKPRTDPTPALRALFPQGRPQVPAGYRDVLPHVTHASVKASHPTLLGAAKPLPGASEGTGAIVLDIGTDKVRYLRFELPAEAEAVLAAAWGPGRVAKRNGRRAASFWFEDGRQFILIQQGTRLRLEVWPYTPINTFLGAKLGDLGSLLGTPVKGFKKRFAAARWKEQDGALAFVAAPPPFYTRPVTVRLTVKRGRVVGADYRVFLGAYAEQVAEAEALLAGWGEPQRPSSTLRLYSKGKTRLQVRQTRGGRSIFQMKFSRVP